MSLIDVNPGEAQELKAVAAGEHEVSIISAEVVPTKSDPSKMQIALSLRIEGEKFALPVRDWIGIPKSDDDEVSQNRKLLRLKAFCECFDYDFSGGIETEELPGRTGKVILRVEHDEDYGDQNRVSRYLAA